MLAILENSSQFHRGFTSGTSGNRWAIGLQVLGSMCAFAFALSVGILVFTPQQLLARQPAKMGD
jgi:hypothetical protein